MSLDTQNSQVGRIQRRNRTQLLLIAGIALLSLGGAYALFYLAKQTGGWGTTNHGEFVDPPISAVELGWQVDEPQRKWWIWVVDQRCGDDCLNTLQNMRAAHTLLNREADRVRRGLTVQAGGGDAALAQFPALASVLLSRPELVQRGIYLVDPLGNLVLRYAMDADPQMVLDDLKKLLKFSQIG